MASKITEGQDTLLQFKEYYFDILSSFPLPQFNITYGHSSTVNLSELAVMNTFFNRKFKGSDVIVAGKIHDAGVNGNGSLTKLSSVTPTCNNPGQSSNDSIIQVVISAAPPLSKTFKVYAANHPVPNYASTATITTATASPAQTLPSGNNFIERSWAYLKVKELLDQAQELMKHGDDDELNEVTEYAKTLAIDVS